MISLAVAAAGWVGSSHPEITQPSNFYHLRDTTGEDVAERLDVIPAKFPVIITRRPKYAFKGWDGVIQALAPSHIIESGLPTEALLGCRSTGRRAFMPVMAWTLTDG